MVTLALQHQTVKSVSYSVDIPEGTNIELENSYSFNVDYLENNSRCVATLKHTTRDTQNPERFTAEIHIVGYSECIGIENDDDKALAHVQAYIQLFPYVQSYIAYLTASSGLPPLFISRDLIETHISDVNVHTKEN